MKNRCIIIQCKGNQRAFIYHLFSLSMLWTVWYVNKYPNLVISMCVMNMQIYNNFSKLVADVEFKWRSWSQWEVNKSNQRPVHQVFPCLINHNSVPIFLLKYVKKKLAYFVKRVVDILGYISIWYCYTKNALSFCKQSWQKEKVISNGLFYSMYLFFFAIILSRLKQKRARYISMMI